MLLFYLADYAFPGQPVEGDPSISGVLLAGYGVASALLMVATWNNWWLDHKLALPTHLIDIGFFAFLVVVTEGYVSTPFFVFFIFLVLSAFRRFGARQALATATMSLVLYSFAGVVSQVYGLADDRWDRLVLRRYYVALLMMVSLWFVVNRRDLFDARARSAVEAVLPVVTGPDGLGPLLTQTRGLMFAQRAMLLLSDPEEPWSWLEIADAEGVRRERLDPDMVAEPIHPALAGRAFIASASRARQLVMVADDQVEAREIGRPLVPALVGHAGGLDLVVAPVRADDRDALLILAGVEGLCSDDLGRAQDLADEIARGIDRLALVNATAKLAIGNARVALARDIHDSVLQTLTGTGFRLAALRQSLQAVPAGDGPDLPPPPALRLIDDLQDQLARAQADVRDHVSALRDQPGQVEAGAGLAALVGRLERQWGVECQWQGPAGPLTLPAPTVGELRQLLREMVANAARHGRATTVSIALSAEAGHVVLGCRDNGIGMAAAGAPEGATPWSISERVAALGGRMDLSSDAKGTAILISLPLDG